MELHKCSCLFAHAINFTFLPNLFSSTIALDEENMEGMAHHTWKLQEEAAKIAEFCEHLKILALNLSM